MGNYPQFLIGTNKKAAQNHVFLLHSEKPKFLGEILSFNSISDFESYRDSPNREHVCKISGQTYTICARAEVKGKIIGLFVIDFFDSPLGKSGEINVDGLMANVEDWLKTYYSE
jgi:hypothetical protein